MAQAHINAAEGEDPSDYDVASDATGSIETIRVIIANGVDRHVAANLLRDIAREVEDGDRDWPFA